MPRSAGRLHIAPLAERHRDAFHACLDIAFHMETVEATRKRWHGLLRDERTAIAYEDDRLVGTSGAFELPLSVPGGELPCAAISDVTVLPTHRRRGLLTAMMGRLLEQAREAGEPLAALWASEGGVYERYGFGVATREVTLELPGGSPAPRGAIDWSRRLELVPLDRAAKLLGPLYDRVRSRRAGMPARDRRWWEKVTLADVPQERDGALAKRLVVARSGTGAAAGYALYRAKPGEPDAALEALELLSPDGEVEGALWGFLCAVDLVGTVRAPHRPVDDPLPRRLADFGQARVTDVAHALWLRILDVPAAVAGRTWAAPLDLVVELDDARVPENAGRWRIEASAEGDARATREEDRAADLALDAAALGALYLGGVAPAQLADAGRIEERSPGALDALAAALRTPRAPWCPEEF